MMMGPTKKKVIATGIIAFTIPVVLGSVAFMQYNKKKEAEIAELKRKSETTKGKYSCHFTEIFRTHGKRRDRLRCAS